MTEIMPSLDKTLEPIEAEMDKLLLEQTNRFAKNPVSSTLQSACIRLRISVKSVH